MNQILEASLNFVPQDKRKQIRQSFVVIILQKFAFSLCCLTIIISLSLLGVKILFQNKLQKLENQYEQNAKQINSKKSINIVQAIKELNQMTTRINTMQKEFIYWSSSISGFKELVPTGIQITAMTISATSKQAVCNGIADTRTSLSTFKSNLGSSKLVSKSDFPISLEKVSIPFTATITFTDSFFIHE